MNRFDKITIVILPIVFWIVVIYAVVSFMNDMYDRIPPCIILLSAIFIYVLFFWIRIFTREDEDNDE